MLLVEFTINSTLHYISQEGIALTHWWDNQVISFDAPQYNLTNYYGGYCQMSFGNIELSHNLFISDWPPPIKCDITIKYTTTTEAAATTFFDGTAHLVSITRESVIYDLYDLDEDTKLLATATDYNSNTVPLPRAFGSITHQNPVRLPDVAGKPTYHKAYVYGTKGTDWHVYDDGVNIDANVTDNGDGTFSLSATPVGEVTISGTGKYGTSVDDKLSSIFEWACGASYLNLTFNSTYAESPSLSVSYWANTQNLLIGFLSDLSSFFAHLYYISDSTLYLVDMNTDGGSRTLTEFDFFPSVYNYNVPIKSISSNWITRSAVTETIGKYIKNINNNTVRTSIYPYGNNININSFHDTLNNINSELDDILTILHKPKTNLKIPLQGNLPVPGEKISWTDTSLGQDTDMYIRCRSLRYDFDNEEITIEGEGVITAS